jgi:RNA-directed DNA polymerase
LRPLGIPNIRDRVCQMAALLILEPIFEADFLGCSYGFRPGRSAHQALEVIAAHLKAGHREVYDADLQGYFDSIPHDKLLACVRMRVVDRSVLRLIRQWLTAEVEEEDEGGQSRRSRPQQGTPQGGVLSPLLANVYLHWFDVLFHRSTGPAQFAQAKLVRYADDFVILAAQQGAELAAWVEQTLEGWLGLQLNRAKTRVVNLQAEGTQLDFLGYSFRYERDAFGGNHRYLRLEPAAKSLTRARARVKELTGAASCCQPLQGVVGRLNRYLRGWYAYFGLGYWQRAFRKLGSYVRERLSRYVNRRSQRRQRRVEGRSLYRLWQELGLQAV